LLRLYAVVAVMINLRPCPNLMSSKVFLQSVVCFAAMGFAIVTGVRANGIALIAATIQQLVALLMADFVAMVCVLAARP
jgi:hypothetical protein